jgi:hypothetical protein
MIRISIPYLIEFAASLDRLDRVAEGGTVGDVYGFLFNAKNQLDQLFGASLYAPAMRSSKQLAVTLFNSINHLLSQETTSTVDAMARWTLLSSRDQFRTAFSAELNILPSFFVSQKGGFDTQMLLDSGWSLFPADLTAKAPETIADVTQAARALAFDMGTASAFHVFRVLEAVLRRYYAVVSGGSSLPKVRSIGTYIAALRKCPASSPSVLSVLQQIKDLHRNPLIHPEAMITTDQAISLFGVVRSAIEAMLASLPAVSSEQQFGGQVTSPIIP